MTNINDLAKQSVLISATPLLDAVCIECRPKQIDNLSICDYFILAGTELGFISFTALGVIETVFWGALALLAKAIHVCLPQFEITDKIFAQLYASTLFALSGTVIAAVMVGKNFFIADNKIEEEIFKPYIPNFLTNVGNYWDDFVNYRFFGSSAV